MRSVNLRLHQVLLGYGKSHTDVFETTSFQSEDFMTHGLHLNLTRQKEAYTSYC